jgi:two-component system chemotaxis response regulator CheY
MQIALIDDDILQRSLLCKAMARVGLRVCEQASDGAEALQMLNHSRADVIITDCDMPKMNGIQLVQALRKNGDARPILMLSGHPEVATEALQAGVTHFLPKPLDMPQLLKAIKSLTNLGTAA